MGPVVAQVEDVEELLAAAEAGELGGAQIGHRLVVPVGVGDGDAFVAAGRAVGVSEVELVEVGEIPAGEGVINGLGELGEGVAASRHERAPGPGPKAAGRDLR